MNDQNEQPLQSRLLGDKVVVVNIGLSTFEEALNKQPVELIVVAWRPPRQIPSDVEDLLAKLI